jgi:hypothetical protein
MKLVLTGCLVLTLACAQSPAREPQQPQQPTVVASPAAAEEAKRPVVTPAAPVDAPPVVETPTVVAPVPSAYTIGGVSLSSVTLAGIETALKKVGCKRFDERSSQTIGPYEYLSTRCQLKRGPWRNTTFSLRRPAVTPATTTIDPEQFSPARWQRLTPGELWDEPANVYVDVLIHADNASELSRPLFESIVKKP